MKQWHLCLGLFYKRKVLAFVALEEPSRITNLVDAGVLSSMMGGAEDKHIALRVYPLSQLVPVGDFRPVFGDLLQVQTVLRGPLKMAMVGLKRAPLTTANTTNPARSVQVVDKMVMGLDVGWAGFSRRMRWISNQLV